MRSNVVCGECKAEWKRSMVTPEVPNRTRVDWKPFYDEDGHLHQHDPNVTVTHFTCSQGHHWNDEAKGKCACGWVA